VLASDVVYAEAPDSFANNVQAISGHQAGRPFDSLNLTVARYEGQFSKERFLVIAYAMWRTATEHRLHVGSLTALEAYLQSYVTHFGRVLPILLNQSELSKIEGA